MKAREGQFIQTFDNFIFDVKGLVHPPDRIIAFVRYVPDELGNRELKNRKFRKIYDLTERFEYLQNIHPEYIYYDEVFGTELMGVLKKDITQIYDPIRKLKEIIKLPPKNKLHQSLIEMMKILEKYGANIDHMGISGSILVDLETTTSDIDLICYGKKNCKELRSILIKIYENNERIKKYNFETIKDLYEFRGHPLDFETFAKMETQKVLQGKFDDIDFYIRCVKDWDEIDEQYGDVKYRKIGIAEIEATIIDDSESFMTPVKYLINVHKIISGPRLEISEIASFRGRFCELAKKGDIIRARGTIEEVYTEKNKWFRLLLGNSNSDFMIQKI